MKSKNTIIFCTILGACLLGGCGSGPVKIEQASDAEVQTAMKERQFFNTAKGVFSALSPEDQAAYNKLAGGAEPGQAVWKVMSKNGFTAPGGGNPNVPPEVSGRH
jgi:hypothetical protein